MTQTKTRLMCTTALCAALVAVVSPWSIPLPGGVGLTLGVFAVFFAGAVLPAGWAATACVLYLLIGAVGVPVFSGMQGGLQVLAGMTGGYLWAYPLMAAILSFACARTKNVWLRFAAVPVAMLVCYALGTAWFMHVMGMELMPSLAACVFPFIVPDLLKGAAAVLLGKALEKRLK